MKSTSSVISVSPIEEVEIQAPAQWDMFTMASSLDPIIRYILDPLTRGCVAECIDSCHSRKVIFSARESDAATRFMIIRSPRVHL